MEIQRKYFLLDLLIDINKNLLQRTKGIEYVCEYLISEVGRMRVRELGKVEFKRGGRSQLAIPLYLNPVPAGFPSPAEDYQEGGLDLNEYLVRNPAATFMVRVSGDSMVGAGIQDGDVLVVDRSLEPAHGKIVVAVLDGELAVKRLYFRAGECRLVSENGAYKDIQVGQDQDLHVWGGVAAVVRRYV